MEVLVLLCAEAKVIVLCADNGENLCRTFLKNFVSLRTGCSESLLNQFKSITHNKLNSMW